MSKRELEALKPSDGWVSPKRVRNSARLNPPKAGGRQSVRQRKHKQSAKRGKKKQTVENERETAEIDEAMEETDSDLTGVLKPDDVTCRVSKEGANEIDTLGSEDMCTLEANKGTKAMGSALLVNQVLISGYEPNENMIDSDSSEGMPGVSEVNEGTKGIEECRIVDKGEERVVEVELTEVENVKNKENMDDAQISSSEVLDGIAQKLDAPVSGCEATVIELKNPIADEGSENMALKESIAIDESSLSLKEHLEGEMIKKMDGQDLDLLGNRAVHKSHESANNMEAKKKTHRNIPDLNEPYDGNDD